MRSHLVEFHRFGNTDIGLLRADDPYLLVDGFHTRTYKVLLPIDYDDYWAHLQRVRYQGSDPARRTSLQKLSDVIGALLGNLQAASTGSDDLVQLDLVLTPVELAALPFELWQVNGQAVFPRRDRPVVLTRRVRNEFRGLEDRLWPTKPRVLYLWASPAGAGPHVPHADHDEALKEALRPWMQPAAGVQIVPEDGLLTVCSKASLPAIRALCQQAADRQEPFTHVHVLCHGVQVPDAARPMQRYGVALHDPDDAGRVDAVSAERLRRALEPVLGSVVAVSLAVCDSGNIVTISSDNSLAHELHKSGVPVVLASQFPLTFEGSVTMTRSFYQRLLTGEDVRRALHETRVALFESAGAEADGVGRNHDWASLVGYVRLPENYDAVLREIRLQTALGQMVAVTKWSAPLENPLDLQLAREALIECIRRLETYEDDDKLSHENRLELVGLLGSAHKRLAEICYREGQMAGNGSAEARTQMKKALVDSHAWYGKAFRANLSHHWSGVQALALETVIWGGLARPALRTVAREAALLELGSADDRDGFWALGSLAELELLDLQEPAEERLARAADYLRRMVAVVAASRDEASLKMGVDPLDSTRLQFHRYVYWWTAANGFFDGNPDLVKEAERLLRELST